MQFYSLHGMNTEENIKTRILVVDDDPEHLRIIEQLLKKQNYCVNTARNGHDCMAAIQHEKPDLLLLDVILPDTNGLAICKTIKQDPLFAPIYVLMLSGFKTESENISEGLESGADGYLLKPVPKRELLARVKAGIRIIQTEKKLRNLSNQFETILDHIPGLVFYKDKNNTFIRVNQYVAQAYQKTKKELEGLNLSELYPPEVAARYHQDDLDVLHSGVAKLHIKEPWETTEGLRWVSTSKIPLVDDTGAMAGVIGVSLDITEQKCVEDALLESEEQLRNLIACNADGMVVVDQHGIVQMSNPAAAALFKTPLEKMTGLQFGFPIDSGGDTEINLIRPNNSLITVEMRVSQIRWMKAPAFLVSLRDMTQRKISEQEIKKKNEELQRLNAEKDKFFSILAHDLKSPFNSFLGLTHMMAEELPALTIDQIQKISVGMMKSATNLYTILENLLEWSTLQRGLLLYKPATYFLKSAVSDSIELVSEISGNKKITITNEIPEDLTIYADEKMVASIFRNLISNALKFTPRGGKITVSATQVTNNSVEISVKDTGIGMNPDIITNLFRLDKETNRKGTEGELSTGLGLIICKDFIERHGGKLRIESKEKKGSTFYVTLPAKPNNT